MELRHDCTIAIINCIHDYESHHGLHNYYKRPIMYVWMPWGIVTHAPFLSVHDHGRSWQCTYRQLQCMTDHY